jgi:hypothetical protein
MDTLLEELRQALEASVEGFSTEQMSWHPAEKWCAAEVLEHLYLTYTGTVKGFDRVLSTGRPLAGRASMKQRWRTLVVLGFDYLPEGRKAPKQTVPRGLPVEKVRSEVGLKLKEMDDIIARAVDRLGHGQLLDHPSLGPLTGAQWRKFHYLHGRHHIRQIVRLRDLAQDEATSC